MSSVYLFLFPWEGFPRQTCNSHLRPRTKMWDQIQTVVWQFFCASLGKSLCHGNQHHGIDPNMSNSGHHDCSKKAVFLCTAVKLAILPHVGTLNSAYWAFSHLSISIHFSNSFESCSMQFFLGPAWGESCVASATIETHWYHWYPMSTFSYFRGKAFLGKPATITFGENKDINSSIKFRL